MASGERGGEEAVRGDVLPEEEAEEEAEERGEVCDVSSAILRACSSAAAAIVISTCSSAAFNASSSIHQPPPPTIKHDEYPATVSVTGWLDGRIGLKICGGAHLCGIAGWSG